MKVKHDPDRPNIRDRLRAWEAENPEPPKLISKDSSGPRSNGLRGQSPFMVEIEAGMDGDDSNQQHFDGDDMVDLRSNADDIQGGDMIEIG